MKTPLRMTFVLLAAEMLLAIGDPLWLSASSDAIVPMVARDRMPPFDCGELQCRRPFDAILIKHNNFQDNFVRWRNLVAEHADALAQLLKTFPDGKNLNAEHLRRIFSKPREYLREIAGRKVFAPWTNRWSGTWSNGVPQYHVWEATYFCNGQWIQPVSLSEYGFSGFHGVQEKLQSGLADIAINVFSDELGVTGWVSKWQNDRVEMPHLGYWVNESTLVWFCQVRKPEELFVSDNRWFVFLETVDCSANPIEYKIYGVQVVVEKTVSVIPEQVGTHFGTYYKS